MKKALLRIIVALQFVIAVTVSHSYADTLADAFSVSYQAEAQGNYQAAIKPLRAQGAGSSYVGQVRLGWLNYRAKDWQQSITWYHKASRQAPRAIEPLLGMMLAQQGAGETYEAIETGQAVLQKDPHNYTAISRTAWLLYQRREYVQAAAMYRKLVDLYPTDTEMLLGLGYSLKLAGNKEESAQCFTTVLLLSPSNARALEGLRDGTARP